MKSSANGSQLDADPQNESGVQGDPGRRFSMTVVARVTGLEPATSGVTGRRSNQLSYTRLASTGGGGYGVRQG